MFKVGHVIQYYERIGVAIIELDNFIAVGDNIKFVKDDQDLFSQRIDTIQVEHKKVESAGRGEVVGIKVNSELKEGCDIFKI